jgi:hypothetical protein
VINHAPIGKMSEKANIIKMLNSRFAAMMEPIKFNSKTATNENENVTNSVNPKFFGSATVFTPIVKLAFFY